MPGSGRPVGYIVHATWFAMIAAIGDLSVLAFRKYGRHESLLVGPDVLWMTPLAAALLLIVPAVLLLAIRRVRGKAPGATRPAIFVFALLASATVLLGIPRLYPSALLLVSAAIAWRVSRKLPLRSERLAAFVRRSTAGMVGAFVLVGVLVGGGRRWTELRQIASLPSPPADAPNVLLIIWDTVRAASLGLYGYERATSPNLERLADSGVVFTRAIATAPWTLPSHASMFTGRYASEMSADFRAPFDGRYPTLAEQLRARGYVTAGFVGNTFYTGYESGLARGFIHYDDYPVSLRELVLSSALGRLLVTNNAFRERLKSTDIFARRTAADVNGRFLSWLDRRADRPFFAFINLFDAHEPYRPPARFEAMFGPQDARRLTSIDHRQLRNATRWGRRNLPPDEKQAERDAYDGALAYLDDELGLLLAELDRRGLRGNTVVIVTSDHGEHFGERDQYGHGNTVYTPVVHVPLVIAGTRRVPAGLTESRAVSLRSLAATVLDLAEPGSPPGIPGVSMARYWNAAGGVANGGDTVLAEFEDEDLRSVVDGRYHYIWRGLEAAELYDLDTDPMEATDLAGTDSARVMIERARTAYQSHLLREWKRDKGQPPPQQAVTSARDVP